MLVSDSSGSVGKLLYEGKSKTALKKAKIAIHKAKGNDQVFRFYEYVFTSAGYNKFTSDLTMAMQRYGIGLKSNNSIGWMVFEKGNFHISSNHKDVIRGLSRLVENR